jgi:hypothetical protein
MRSVGAVAGTTALLVIVAAILALVAIARIDHFVENVVATTTEAVLSKVDLPPKDVPPREIVIADRARR